MGKEKCCTVFKKEKRKRDCPFEQSLKRKRETKIVLDKS
jgi:hypothetical protein